MMEKDNMKDGKREHGELGKGLFNEVPRLLDCL
jgi:hypothetical protein